MANTWDAKSLDEIGGIEAEELRLLPESSQIQRAQSVGASELGGYGSEKILQLSANTLHRPPLRENTKGGE